jgi:hypothetical protein
MPAFAMCACASSLVFALYSPFLRRWSELNATDLEQLKSASEGWNVEYKRDVPKAEAAGKSLSSFANSYGGWIFYGVETPAGGSSLPTAFPGIADADVPRVLDMLQKSASNVSPHPFFEHEVIAGPDAATMLPAGHSIVVVRVPPGAQAPYIHKNGRIYRRVADSSEPTHETDRHVLDLLWERSNDARNQWRTLVEQDFELEINESQEPRVHVFLSCDPNGDCGVDFDLPFDEFVTHMRGSTREAGLFPFDNFYTGPDCFIARQTTVNDPYLQVLTWRQQLDGTAIVSFPLIWQQFDDRGEIFEWLEGYENVEPFQRACEKAQMTRGRLIDLNFLASLLAAILIRYRWLLRQSKISFDFVVKVRVDSVWRTVPFLDLPEFSAFVERHGPPLVQHANVTAPAPADRFQYIVDTAHAGC